METKISPLLDLSGITMNAPNLMNHVRNNNSKLSNRSIAQCTRREHERQIREAEVSTLPNPLICTNSRLSTPSITQCTRRERERKQRESVSIEASVSEVAKNVVEIEVPTPINPVIHITSNFPFSTFEIGESSSPPANVIHHYVEDHYNLSDNDEVEHVNANQVKVQLGRHFLGQINVVCIHCSTLHWRGERLTNSSSSNPRFG
ncbi:hypothetical protein GIB67_023210 [Kingdonia uniflora]|uniref:Uncharacterized protein n=1 Tax=Kingdonia uniflora TaxID=39325 RepID=A0A7J7L938_9MAGN|nr:hypothetical protein GIB67_023210 [Kingdonia uniflora]